MRLRPALVLTAAVIPFTGCSMLGMGAKPAETPAPPAPAPETPAPATTAAGPKSASPSPSQSASSGGEAAPADATKAGTKLKLGEEASVQYVYSKKSGNLKIAVTSIDKGNPDDLKQLKDADKFAGMTPYYMHVKVTGADGSQNLANSSFNGIAGVTDRDQVSKFLVIGNFKPCDMSSLPKDFGPGKTAQGCFVALGEKNGGSIVAAAYTGPSGSSGDYREKPIIWK